MTVISVKNSCWLLAVAVVMVAAGTLLQTQILFNVLMRLRTKCRFSISSIRSISGIKIVVLLKLCVKVTGPVFFETRCMYLGSGQTTQRQSSGHMHLLHKM